MALFRFQRGSLEESLKTTIIVKNMKELHNAISDCYREMQLINKLEVQIDHKQIFDDRCGWYTHLVSMKIDNGAFCAIGFLSEPLPTEESKSDE